MIASKATPAKTSRASRSARRSPASVQRFFDDYLDSCQSKPVRSIMEFAESMIILPMDGGPHQGQPFSREFQPYVSLLFHEIETGPWSLIVIAGPSQSGKTLCAFIIPTIWTVVELKENIVIGIPDGNMINDKWLVDFEPVFSANPDLKQLLPTHGPGSKKGSIKDAVKLATGRVMRFMTKGGSDQSKAGFTARKVAITELAGFSGQQSTSKEADSFRQIIARQKSQSRFDAAGNVDTGRRTWAEGTVTDADDLPWRAKAGSTDSQLLSQCVYEECRQWVRPEREHLRGWRDAEDELEAANKSHFVCPSCERPFDSDQRDAMVRNSRLVHSGQSIDVAGVVSGPLPRTTTMFFRWSAWDNLFLKAADFGTEEWAANQLVKGTPEHDRAERQLCQQTWAIPYEPALIDARPLKPESIARKIDHLPSGVLPADTEKFAFGIDPGLYECWWFGLVGRERGRMHAPVYGRDETALVRGHKTGDEVKTVAIQNTLLRMFDRFDAGFTLMGSGILRSPDVGFVDASFFPEAVFEACRIYGNQSGNFLRYLPIIGRGKSLAESRRYAAPSKTGPIIREIGKGWHKEFIRARGMAQIVIDVDKSKLDFQASWRITTGQPGSATLYDAHPREHRRVTAHFAAEVFRRYLVDGEIREEWKKKGQNHWLDCGGYARTALEFAGWELPAIPHDLDLPPMEHYSPGAVESGDAAGEAIDDPIARRLKELGLA